MGVLSKLFGGSVRQVGYLRTQGAAALSQRGVACSQCGCPMLIISNTLVRRETFEKSQGCYRCASCGRYTSYEHSDNRVLCRCGAKQTRQLTYVSGRESTSE
jgi:hypothetical protein